MTAVDNVIPYYYWFKNGFGEIGLPMSMANLAMLVITLLTIKGIYVPVWVVLPIAGLLGIGCIGIGWFLERYAINARISTHVIRNQNPVLSEMSNDIKTVKKLMEMKQ